MNKSNSQQQLPNGKKRFSLTQYDFLICCSKKKDLTEWNEWRKNNPDEDILLEGARLSGRWLKAILLNRHSFTDENGEVRVFSGKVYLKDADFNGAVLDAARLNGANLENAEMSYTHLENAEIMYANLKNINLCCAHLEGANFEMARVNSDTLIWDCQIDKTTYFHGVGLYSARIDEQMKQHLKYNIRRSNWEKWYNQKNRSLPELCNLTIWLARRLVRCFWGMSDYGKSTWRIIVSFFGLAFIFAVIYRLWPDFVLVNGEVGGLCSLFHSFYFSVVTMTTLGFGDIAANPDSWQGQLLLVLQVLLGYILLGALVARLAVLFTGGGPTSILPSRGESAADQSRLSNPMQR